MIGEVYEIVPGTYNNEQEVQVKFTKTVEQDEVRVYSEQDVLNTITYLEQQKIEFCAAKDQEIAINNQMLLKIRAIERPINTVE